MCDIITQVTVWILTSSPVPVLTMSSVEAFRVELETSTVNTVKHRFRSMHSEILCEHELGTFGDIHNNTNKVVVDNSHLGFLTVDRANSSND